MDFCKLPNFMPPYDKSQKQQLQIAFRHQKYLSITKLVHRLHPR